ncbi:mechanosensitive ion channel family protein [Mesorhizobium sp. LHD-90]|uniref:mechanosensitive ion channel family protein n=1 Tax=Mesorhizobium sp. LHD-90 TaxID=3071414 RepID=UPI0027E1F12C|nr:mechanosensitive ion channel family protein [Mesorhizobium sp. LHD-90]MDQ6432977.1 mechanosensitive ion channel family protein [Mesorhizobium sp. LHD-90]
MTSTAFRLIAALFLIAAAIAFAPSSAGAQGAGRAGSAIVDQQRSVIGGLTSRTDGLEKEIDANPEDDQKLVDIRLQLEEIARELLSSSVSFRPRLGEINTRIEQLGPPPAQGAAPESDIVATERQSLAAEKAEINATLGAAEDLSIRVNTLITRVTDMRRDLFSRLLTKRYDINFPLLSEVLVAFHKTSADLYRSVSAWLRFVFNFKLSSVLAATFFALIAAVILLVGGRRLFGHLFEADPQKTDPTYLSRLSVAFWSTLLPSLTLGVFLGVTYFLFDYFGVLRGDIGSMLASLFAVIGLVFFVHRLGKAVLSPHLPHWRLIPVQSGAAAKLLWIMSATALFSGFDYLASNIYETLDAPVSLTVGEALVATVIIGLLVLASGLVRPFADETGQPKAWPAGVRLFIYALGLMTIVAALLGFIGLARFISQQIVFTGAVLATMYIGFLSSRAVAEEGAFAHTAIGVRFQRWFKLDDAGLDQLSLLVSILINVAVVVVGLPLVLFQWGFQPADIGSWMYKFATGIQIGSFTLSLTGILWGIVVFGVGFVLTRWFQGWLDGSVMARGRVDTGVRNSIRTVLGYAGLAIAGLAGLSAAGIDFSNLALIAGGLSLGIGFGLQNVVSNFVSGLILLAERPFKAGDWVIAGDVSGTVKKISVRATEIETFQRQTVIMPNSTLINGAVGNWTHRNKLGRIEIPVAVAYGTDARKVHALLMELASSHPLVLKNPEPFVAFTAFAQTSMTFEIRVFLGDIGNGGIVQNDLRFAILDAFERENISIAIPAQSPVAPPTPKWSTDDDKAEAELAEAVERRVQAEEEVKTRKTRRKKTDPV